MAVVVLSSYHDDKLACMKCTKKGRQQKKQALGNLRERPNIKIACGVNLKIVYFLGTTISLNIHAYATCNEGAYRPTYANKLACELVSENFQRKRMFLFSCLAS